MRSIFDFSVENAENQDCEAERVGFELSVPICEQSDEAPCVVELNQNQSRPLSTDCFAERPVHHPCATSG